jgi:serralysin
MGSNGAAQFSAGSDDDAGAGAIDSGQFLNGGDRGLVTVGGKPSFAVEVAGAYLARADASWGAGATISYAFRGNASTIMPSDTAGFSRFNAAQITAAELALQSWSDLANISFVRQGSGVSGEGAYSDSATILFGNYASGQDGAAAFAMYPPVTSFDSSSGDAWFRSGLSYNTTPALGNYGRTVLVHEIGHTIGLDHPGDYDSGEGDPTYAASADYYEDSNQFTVMSYWSETNTGGIFRGFEPAAPLLDDIAAIQQIYGPNMSTRTGDTTYGFHSDTGRDFYSLSSPADRAVFAVWDAGGYDTLDFSNYSQGAVIDLRQGSFSSVGGLTGNIAIAMDTVIERAIGGAGGDTMYAMAYEAPVPRADIVKPQATANISAGSAVSLDGAFDLSFEANVASSTSLPHATVRAVSSGGHEYYGFTVSDAGATAIFDVDGIASADGYLRLYDTAGRELASDDDFARDPGSSLRQDPFIAYTFATPGNYYIAVEQFENVPGEGTSLPAGTAYTLNVSLSSAATSGALTGSQLEGGGGQDQLIGGPGSDILYGQLGHDTLRDGGGSEGVRDFLYGGEGNDTYYVTSSLTGPLDLVYEGGDNPDVRAGPSDVDTIYSQGSFFWDYYSVAEFLRIDNPSGSELVGGQLGQSIFGDTGTDLILAYGGSNVVDAGSGTDAVSFGLFGLDEAHDGVNTLVMKPGSGLDYVYDFESGVDKIDLTAFHFGITGQQVLDQAINVDQTGVANDYSYFYLTSAGGVDNYVAFIGLLSNQLHATDFLT